MSLLEFLDRTGGTRRAASPLRTISGVIRHEWLFCLVVRDGFSGPTPR